MTGVEEEEEEEGLTSASYLITNPGNLPKNEVKREGDDLVSTWSVLFFLLLPRLYKALFFYQGPRNMSRRKKVGRRRGEYR